MELREALAYVGNPEPYDVDRYQQAGETLVQNRDNLTHRVFYKIPDPGSLSTNLDPRWGTMKSGSTCERCSCGNCRTIWPKKWPKFVEKETVTLREGEVIYVVPEGGNHKDTTVRLAVEKNAKGELLLTFIKDPFSEAMDFNMLLSGPPAYPFGKLERALAKQSKPAYFQWKFPPGADVDAEYLTACSVNGATSTEVVIGIGEGYVVGKNPEVEFPA